MKALKLLEAFFPMECPLLQHISQTYEKRFVSDLHEIPEEATPQSQKASANRSRASRSHSHNPDSRLPVIRDRPRPRSPSAEEKKEEKRGKPRVIRKTSMELRNKDSDKLRPAYSMYQSRRAALNSLPHTRSFDRERRNKSAEVVGEPGSSHLENYLLGVMETRTQSPGTQFIVS